MEDKILNIDDRQADFKEIDRQSWRAEKGIRSICVMYDDHSSDKNSKENIFLLKDNVHYRIFSLKHQYLIFLRELNYAEHYLQELHQKDPKKFNAFPMGNPYFEKVDLEISSVFDNIIFQLSSVFDYLSHLICYICLTNKSKTLYWTKLASSAHGKNNEFSNLEIGKVIAELDKKIAGKLYDYRSRLLHNKKDQHIFNTSVKLVDFRFDLKILASDLAIKHFKVIREEYPDEKITLAFLSSWLIKKCFIDIESILDALRLEILKNSYFHQNLTNPKVKNGLMFLSVDPKTNFAKPVSDGLWEQYKNKK
ncbi:hypothetical protein [Aquimarina brevivitae]|uniref:Uncharacterized protein n=1 Tax=Aquimarina brevivitae TaxID=323412 RepID=A0A4Q7P3J0_9FLAO|nr:hypothetical protein [Aquimarina brevivitae]RZS93242.1 hypothetical protein EV197_1818 [Aquimarina brevivitae]